MNKGVAAPLCAHTKNKIAWVLAWLGREDREGARVRERERPCGDREITGDTNWLSVTLFHRAPF